MTPGQFIIDHLDVVILGLFTLIEITPVKINPWTKILRFLGNSINGDIRKDVTELKRDFEETKAKDMRWHILDFSNSCRHGRMHSREEWVHVIEQLKEYEVYTETKEIENGVIEEEAKYLRRLYQERCEKNDFL